MEQPPCGLKVYKFASFREYMLTFEHHHPHYRLLPAVVVRDIEHCLRLISVVAVLTRLNDTACLAAQFQANRIFRPTDQFTGLYFQLFALR